MVSPCWLWRRTLISALWYAESHPVKQFYSAWHCQTYQWKWYIYILYWQGIRISIIGNFIATSLGGIKELPRILTRRKKQLLINDMEIGFDFSGPNKKMIRKREHNQLSAWSLRPLNSDSFWDTHKRVDRRREGRSGPAAGISLQSFCPQMDDISRMPRLVLLVFYSTMMNRLIIRAAMMDSMTIPSETGSWPADQNTAQVPGRPGQYMTM